MGARPAVGAHHLVAHAGQRLVAVENGFHRGLVDPVGVLGGLLSTLAHRRGRSYAALDRRFAHRASPSSAHPFVRRFASSADPAMTPSKCRRRRPTPHGDLVYHSARPDGPRAVPDLPSLPNFPVRKDLIRDLAGFLFRRQVYRRRAIRFRWAAAGRGWWGIRPARIPPAHAARPAYARGSRTGRDGAIPPRRNSPDRCRSCSRRMGDVIDEPAARAPAPGVDEIEHQRRVHRNGGMQRGIGIPRLVAHARHRRCRCAPWGRERDAPPVAGHHVAGRIEPVHLHLHALHGTVPHSARCRRRQLPRRARARAPARRSSMSTRPLHLAEAREAEFELGLEPKRINRSRRRANRRARPGNRPRHNKAA